MKSVEKVKRWRDKKSKEGGRSLSVWLEPDTARLLDEIREEQATTKVKDIVKAAITQLHKVTCNPDETPTFTQFSDRLANGESIADMKHGFIRMIKRMESDGLDVGRIKQLLNKNSFPTLSEKDNWTEVEVRQLLKRA